MQVISLGLKALLIAALVTVLAADTLAQSGSRPAAPRSPAASGSGSKNFGSNQASNFRNQNSASRFSVSNIQNNLRASAVRPVGIGGVNRKSFLGSSSPLQGNRSKPFAGVSRGPAVSPYLALSAPRASASDYQSIIRPQQQQARANQRQQILAFQQQRRLNQLAARGPYNPKGDENSAPTGHVAVFQSLGSYQNTGGYFPPPSAGKTQ